MSKPVSLPRCPKCKSNTLLILEEWTWGSIPWKQIDGGILVYQDHDHGGGDPQKVVAHCDCGHWWTLRGVRQIIDLPNYPSDTLG